MGAWQKTMELQKPNNSLPNNSKPRSCSQDASQQCIAVGDGRNCEPINPCSEGSNDCSNQARCVYTTPGQFDCKCLDGYRGDGRVCVEIDNCLENRGGCHYRARYVD